MQGQYSRRTMVMGQSQQLQQPGHHLPLVDQGKTKDKSGQQRDWAGGWSDVLSAHLSPAELRSPTNIQYVYGLTLATTTVHTVVVPLVFSFDANSSK